ncbi:hypothetical protein [Edaphobacter aggregans]|uniref:hypothetical protein n=1 Tax=Edaphobacter aggregans TaxID=570835 RepID=UPI000F7480E1|nr:hypothetical protein [Edaphobacter aggregans]
MDHEPTSANADDGTTGTLPPPRPQLVEWKTAIRCAVLVAIVAAALSVAGTRVPMVSALGSLWIISGSLITVGLYQRRRPLALMDAGVGARIGLVAGLALITCLGVSMAVAGLVARYGLHNMAAFDGQLTEQLHAQIEKAAAANPAPPEVIRFMYTPEFRAGIMLAGFAMVAGALLLLSALGGAVGGMLRMRRRASV